MNTVLSVLIICGFLYLSFVTWMFRRKEGDTKPPSKEEAQPPASGSQLSVVPKSDFDMEDFDQEGFDIGGGDAGNPYEEDKF